MTPESLLNPGMRNRISNLREQGVTVVVSTDEQGKIICRYDCPQDDPFANPQEGYKYPVA